MIKLNTFSISNVKENHFRSREDISSNFDDNIVSIYEKNEICQQKTHKNPLVKII